MLSFLILQLSILFVVIHAGESRIYTDCGSGANVTEFSLTNCKSQPCVLARGKPYQLKITAIGASETQTLPYKVTAKLYLVPVTLEKGNACKELEAGSCPVEPGKQFTYESTITLQKKIPSIKTKVKMLVVDDKGNSVICAYLSVKVK